MLNSQSSNASVQTTVNSQDLAASYAESTGESYPSVLATPAMVGLMERACAKLLRPILQLGQMSVGASISVSHLAPTALGEKVTATAVFERKEKSLYIFRVEARDAAGVIGNGTHARAIVSRELIEKTASDRAQSL